jgi:hypothetical protein
MHFPSKDLEQVIRSIGKDFSDALDWILLQNEDSINNIKEMLLSYVKTRNQFHKAILVILTEMLHEEFVICRVHPIAYEQLDELSQKLGI